jgi:hypothetical protein
MRISGSDIPAAGRSAQARFAPKEGQESSTARTRAEGAEDDSPAFTLELTRTRLNLKPSAQSQLPVQSLALAPSLATATAGEAVLFSQEESDRIAAELRKMAAEAAEASRPKFMVGDYEIPMELLFNDEISRQEGSYRLSIEQADALREKYGGRELSNADNAELIVDLLQSGAINGKTGFGILSGLLRHDRDPRTRGTAYHGIKTLADWHGTLSAEKEATEIEYTRYLGEVKRGRYDRGMDAAVRQTYQTWIELRQKFADLLGMLL